MDLDERIRTRLADDADAEPDDGINLIDSAFRYQAAITAVLDRHAPEQHYVRGQDNKRRPWRVFCKQCRKPYPCDEVRDIAKQLDISE